MKARKGFSLFLASLVGALLLVGGRPTSAYPLATAGETELVASADAEISSDSPSASYGFAGGMLVGYNGYPGYGKLRGLVRFDITQLPVDAIVDQAVLRLYCQGGTNDDPMLVTVHAMTQSWSEASVTWNSHAHEHTSGWYAGATLPQATGDGYEATCDVRALVQSWVNGSLANYGIMLIIPPEPPYLSDGWDVRALVQAWVDGTYPNYGLVLVGGEAPPHENEMGGATFSSREDPDPWVRPCLWVRWHAGPTPTPQPPRLWLPILVRQ